MIKGEQKVNTEQDYRAITIDSSSSLKDFSLDRKKYHRKYILHESVEEKESQAILMGKMVETLLMEPELFDDRFFMSSCASIPTGIMLNFVEALYEATRDATNENGDVEITFESLSKDAYEKSGFKLPYATVIKKFIDSDAEVYYNEIRTVRANNLSVVNTQDVTNAEKIVAELTNNFVTKDIVSLADDERYTILNQFQIGEYELDGHKFKSMLDKVVIDHEKSTVQIYDLKCTWAVENFYKEYYLYRRAYIQGYLYYKAMDELSYDESLNFYGYEILPPKFIVCDSINYYNPLIYSLTENDLMEAYEGFEYNGWKYKGVKDIITDLKWALEVDVWNISRENYLTNGVVNIKE